MKKAEALKIVMEDGEKLRILPDEFKKDRDVVLAAVKNNGWALVYANKNLKRDKSQTNHNKYILMEMIKLN